MIHSPGKLLKLFLALILTAGVLSVAPSAATAHQGGFPSVGTNFGAPGPSAVTEMVDGEHTFYHPTVMGEGGVHHPVIIWGNGTGASPSSYEALLRHWASHGFIVAAANTPNAGSGVEMYAGFEKLANWNTVEGNKFKGMVNLDTVGASGHSQGGGGAIEAGANAKVTTIFPLQPWRGDVSGVTGSAFYMAGENDTIVSPASVRQKFTASNIPAVYGEVAGASHFTPAGDGGPAYRAASTAWARMMLMDDPNTHAWFWGDDAALANSSEWTAYETNQAFDEIDHSDHGEGPHTPPGDCEPTDEPTPPTTTAPQPTTPPTTEAPSDGGGNRFLDWIRRLFNRDRPSTTETAAVAAEPCEPGEEHPHEPGTDPDHGHEPMPGEPTDPDHGHEPEPGEPTDPDHGHEPTDPDHGHEPTDPNCVRKPYDATLPVELCGFPGVTPAQEAEAEALVTRTIERLPQFATTAAASAAGFYSIGDGVSGTEHYINWSYLEDEHFLNPDFPESLVYKVENGRKTLHAAMYMMDKGSTMDDVPDFGGPMIQWHIHDNLCYNTNEGPNRRLVGTVSPGGRCTRGVPGEQAPMIHVWIVPHPCGAFAALDGLGGGTIPDGEEKVCDDGHEH